MDMADPGFVQAGSLRVLIRKASTVPLLAGVELSLQRVGRECWQADTGVTYAAAATSVWCYLLRGRIRLEHAGRAQVAGPGQLIAIPAGAAYRLWVEPAADAEHVIWNATGASPERWWRFVALGAAGVISVRRRREVERCLEQLLQHLCADDAGDRYIARHYLEVVLGLVGIDHRRPAPVQTKADVHAERCRGLIEERGLAIASAQELADAMGLNVDYLSRIYRARFAASPAEHLRRRRMAHAAELLQTSGRPLAEIAVELGFSDAFAFSKAFKTWSGLSPKRWRQQFGGYG